MFTYFLYFAVLLALSPSFISSSAILNESSFSFVMGCIGITTLYILLYIYPLFRGHSRRLNFLFLGSFCLIWLSYGLNFIHTIHDAIYGDIQLSIMKGWSVPGEPVNLIPGILLLLATWHAYMSNIIKNDSKIEKFFFKPFTSYQVIPFLLNILMLIFLASFHVSQSCSNSSGGFN